MTKYEVRAATEADAYEIARNMRDLDKAEVHAITGVGALPLLRAMVRSDAWVALADGRAMCMFGLRSDCAVARVGLVWLLSTDELPKHSMAFARGSKKVVQAWAEQYDMLSGYVDARYEASIRWLKFLGFTIYPAEPHGIDGVPFHRFEMVTS